jgi:V/A-type H+-transporting ATPase subunit E
MNGIQAITAQIIADAQTEADRILAQARARAKECLSAYQEQAYIQSTALLERSERESALREERLSHAAILAARNLRLSTEQEMRERAFAAALKQLSELPDEEYVGVVHGTGGGHSVPEGPGALWQAGGHPGQREAGRRPFDPVCPDPAHPGRADSQRRGRGSELHL